MSLNPGRVRYSVTVSRDATRRALYSVPCRWRIAPGAAGRDGGIFTCGCAPYRVVAEHAAGPVAPAPLGISADRPDYFGIHRQVVRAALQDYLGHSVRGEVAWYDREFIVCADVVLNADLVLLDRRA